jgi:hypothetical protein
VYVNSCSNISVVAEYLYHRYGLLGSIVRFFYEVGPLQRSPRAYVHKKPDPTTNAREWCSCCRSKKVYPASLTSEDASESYDADKVELVVKHKSVPMFGRFLSSSKVNNYDSRLINLRLYNTNAEMRGFNVLSLEPYSMGIDHDIEDTQIVLNRNDDSNDTNCAHGRTVEVIEEVLSVIPETSTDNTLRSLQAETESLLSSPNDSQVE